MPVNVGCIGAAGSLKDNTKPRELGYRVNYINNPTFEVNVADWTPFAGTTLEQSTLVSYIGGASLKVTNTSGGGVQNTTRIPFISIDDVWHISVYIKLESTNATATYYLRHLQYATDTSAAAIASGNIGVVSVSPSDGWVRLSGTFTKSSGANFFVMRIATTSSFNTDIFYVDNALAEYSTSLNDYFDGSYNGFWSGSAHNSKSGSDTNVSRSSILADSTLDVTSVAVDKSLNTIVGYSQSTFSNVTKYDPLGKVLWEKKISNGDSNEVYIADISTDSQDNIIVVGRTDFPVYTGIVLKFDKNGNLLWQKKHTGEYEELYTVAIGPLDSVYVGGSTYFSPPNYTSDIYVIKYDSAGVFQWKRQIRGTSFDEEWVSDGVVDSDGNFYGTCYQLSDISGDEQIYTFKLSTAGALTWQKYIGGSSYEQGDAVALAPNGALYVLGSGYNNSNIIRYDLDGGVIWQKEIANCYLQRIATDEQSNIYMAGDYLVKMDPDGNILWQRSLSPASFVYGLKVKAGYIYIADTIGLYILPDDGSKTGTYTPYFGGTYVYAESSLTDSTTTYPASTPSLTMITSNVVDGSGTLTVTSDSVWAKRYSI
jgi:hypothetical protein